MKGQVSFTWAFFISLLSLLLIAGFWIILDYPRTVVEAHAPRLSTDLAWLSHIESIFNFAPVLILLSWVIYMIIISVQSQQRGA